MKMGKQPNMVRGNKKSGSSKSSQGKKAAQKLAQQSTKKAGINSATNLFLQNESR